MRDWGQLGEASLTSSHSLAAPSGTPSPLLNNIIHLGTRIHTPGSAGESTALTCTSSRDHPRIPVPHRVTAAGYSLLSCLSTPCS